MSRISFFFYCGWFILGSQSVWAQKVVEQQTRFRFAQMHIGIDGQYIPPVQGGYVSATGEQRPLTLPGTYHPRFTIGATHFWGLVDLYVSFPLTSIRPKIDEVQEYGVSTNVATGARIHPLQLRYHRINPYLGVNWSTLSYIQRVNEQLSGATFTKDVIALEGGLNWITGHHWFELGAQYLPARDFSYATSRETRTPVRFPAFTAQLSYKFLIDVTRPLEKDNKAAFGQYLRDHRQLSGFHIDVGPSAAFTLPRSEYNARTRPYLNNPSGNSTFLDASIGYYFYKPDFDIRLAHRHIVADHAAYGLSQQLDRRSISLEVYKYLLDYHGFVPFLGLSLSREQLKIHEIDKGVQVTDQDEQQLTPGLVVGWDIRPVRYESILLRTNLRYSPFLKTRVNGQTISFQQLEFNFIQAVIYPQRILARRKFLKENR
ncbi:hypothetical protein [Spirosoma endophyticum]|uniref:Uncharacterized protein n=1 Tax=Spirosoma endophyticum TaxID=662367 RepID=A0A1I1GRK4_9BACT|nr:hypothetical protein [Spirosoma endophyticum]SFC13932.1 hypothetical protein SAMN05216167_101535 [Spirosoma endophyticum]